MSGQQYRVCAQGVADRSQDRDLGRVRQNQQRSRERKRAYVAGLEQEIARLLAQENNTDPLLRSENDARRHFLRDLGIADSAQELYIKTHIARMGSNATARPDDSTSHNSNIFSGVPLPNKSSAADSAPVFIPSTAQEFVEPGLPARRSSTPVEEPSANESSFELVPQLAQPARKASFRDPRSSGFLEPIWGFPAADFCLENTKMTIDGFKTDGTTACPIAFGIVLQNNARGYSVSKLESKLLAGYQIAEEAGENCRILNKVLFAVLAEISQERAEESLSQGEELHSTFRPGLTEAYGSSPVSQHETH